MKRTTFGAVALVGALLVPPALGAPALAQDDNVAVAENTEDGSSVFRFAFTIKRVAGDVVDPTNAAVAYASCEGCATVAVAMQVVLVSGDPEVVAPQNVAVAVNEDCDLCVTLALAYQYVLVAGDEPVHFTKEGKERLKEVKRAFKELERSDLAPEEVLARVQALAQVVNDVVANEVVVGPPGQAKKEAEADAAASTSTSAPATTTTSTTAGDATTTTTGVPATTSTVASTTTTTVTS